MSGRTGAGEKSRSGAGSTPPECRIAFVDGDTVYRAAMTECLRARGLEVSEFDDPEAAMEEMSVDPTLRVMLVDVEQFWSDGIALTERLSETHGVVPVALVARVRNNQSEEQALKVGAADYLDKRTSPTVVALRLRLLIGGVRGAGQWRSDTPDDVLEVGDLTLWLNSCGALWRGREVRLTVTEFRIVCLLAGDPGRDFSYRRIYDVVHGADFVAGDGPEGHRANVRSLIKKIRKRFRRLDSEFEAIENSPGYGYRWRTPAERGRGVNLQSGNGLSPNGPLRLDPEVSEKDAMIRMGSKE
ncbi:MAG: response regulator transcription factor [Acetobacterales bacterium]